MKPRVYIETTIVSYLTARPTHDLIMAAHQSLTRDWWDTRRAQFDLFCSQLVVNECAAGDKSAAQRRLEALAGIDLLEPTEAALAFAGRLLSSGTIPAKASVDAAHIALATVHGMDYLLTWNCTHIANAEVRPLIFKIARSNGYKVPELCTPEELMGR
jgi:hypothetical protein